MCSGHNIWFLVLPRDTDCNHLDRWLLVGPLAQVPFYLRNSWPSFLNEIQSLRRNGRHAHLLENTANDGTASSPVNSSYQPASADREPVTAGDDGAANSLMEDRQAHHYETIDSAGL